MGVPLVQPTVKRATLHAWPKHKRQRLLARDGWRCAWCRCDLLHRPSDQTIDHLVPRSLGGGSVTTNLVTACRACNQMRGNEDWRRTARRLDPSGKLLRRIHKQRLCPIADPRILCPLPPH